MLPVLLIGVGEEGGGEGSTHGSLLGASHKQNSSNNHIPVVAPFVAVSSFFCHNFALNSE